MSDLAYDSIIIGAGAAGLHCAGLAGLRGQKVIVLDHAKSAGEKIRISGGGRCNFTNLHCAADNFISQNQHFCKSALAGYTPQDFIDLLGDYNILWHEKTLGQLFCDESSQQIVQMLLQQCQQTKVTVKLQTKVLQVSRDADGFHVRTSAGTMRAGALVVACGGLSIPKMGATGLGYDLARQFGLQVITPEPALVPLALDSVFAHKISALAGISVPARVSCGRQSFDEAILFTHRGLSGPAILQISSYWQPGQHIAIDLAPGADLHSIGKRNRSAQPKQSPAAFLAQFLPKRLAQAIASTVDFTRLADMSDAALDQLADKVHKLTIKPTETLGFRIAEVTRGGVDTNELSSKTMQVKSVPGLYFIGEVVDVTGHLGGHNFQWAWASAFACAQDLAK